MVAGIASGGLSTEDVQSIRDTLTAGRRPKVMFTEAAGQVVGQVGQVVHLSDPADGEDFVVVRFGRDELPFSPADVALVPRGAARHASAGRRGSAGSEAPVPVEPEFVLHQPAPTPAPRKESSSMPAVQSSSVQGDFAGDMPAVEAPKPRRAVKAAKSKGLAGLTVTVSYQDGEWTVAAHQGGKALAKPYLIKPAEALKMVALLDVSGVREAVEQIIVAERDQAQEHARRLRVELAEIEAKLAELA